MEWLRTLWSTITGWFRPAPTGGALDVMNELRAEKRTAHPAWERDRNRLATLVFSEADQQRLWKRAHRGRPEAARLLSGITAPTPAEKQRLAELVRELEEGR